MKTRNGLIIFGLLLIVTLVQFESRQRLGDLRKSVGLIFKSPQATLSPDMTRIVAGEFNGLLADYILLEVGSFSGSNTKDSEYDFQNIYRALKQSLSLDPYFIQTYVYAQGLLPWKAKMVDETLELLEISRLHRSWDWRPAYYMGFNYYYFKDNFAKASEVFLEAAKINDAPVLLAILGARFAAKGQRTEAAIVMLKQMLENDALSARDRLEIEQRIAALNGIVVLERAIAHYRIRNERLPMDLETLVSQGIISAMPPNPYDDRFYYDRETGQVAFDQNQIITIIK